MLDLISRGTAILQDSGGGTRAMVHPFMDGASERASQSPWPEPLLWAARSAWMLNRGPGGSRREPSIGPALVLNLFPLGTDDGLVH